MRSKDKINILSFICIVAGLVLIIWVGGSVILRLVIALFGLALVNFGLQLRGLPSIQLQLKSWLDTFRMF